MNINPANLKRYMSVSRTVNVDDKFRKNALSLISGGSTVEITYANGQTLVYDKIKNPEKYIKSLVGRENIVSIKVDNQPFNFEK